MRVRDWWMLTDVKKSVVTVTRFYFHTQQSRAVYGSSVIILCWLLSVFYWRRSISVNIQVYNTELFKLPLQITRTYIHTYISCSIFKFGTFLFEWLCGAQKSGALSDAVASFTSLHLFFDHLQSWDAPFAKPLFAMEMVSLYTNSYSN